MLDERKILVIDTETDGLENTTKIHVMSVGYISKRGEWKTRSTADYDQMRKIVSKKDNIIVGHNFKDFDVPEFEKHLGVKVDALVFDTYWIAKYVFPTRPDNKMSLYSFGQEFGIDKVEIEDWVGLDYERYQHRCEVDVKINIALWEKELEILFGLYETEKAVFKALRYLMFKVDCVNAQRELKCKIDLQTVHDNIQKLLPLKKEKEEILIEAMPPGKPIKKRPSQMKKVTIHKRPANLKKKDGSYSVAGQKWLEKLRERNLPEQTTQIVDECLTVNGEKWMALLKEKDLPENTAVIYDEPNPGSDKQIKDWLFSLGWKPDFYKPGANGPVPQLRDEDKNLCDSVLKLAEEEPAINELDGLTVINHRLGLLNDFLQHSSVTGYVVASAQGLTNTLRLRHKKPIVNLPKVTKKKDLRDGQIIRECIVAEKGKVLCGSDISSLEDQTKRHYMWEYDEEYVIDQMKPGFDPHLDLAVRCGAMTQEQADEHKLYSKSEGKEGVDHSTTRNLYKKANYSCVYGIGVAGLARTLEIPRKRAKEIIDGYWERNWSVKHIPRDVPSKMVAGSTWIQNPVSKLWYSLRHEKDTFSTLNQGTGSFVFDLWVKLMNKRGLYPILQYHDEVLLQVDESEEDQANARIALEEAMQEVNRILKLNVTIEIDVQFGKTYADVH